MLTEPRQHVAYVVVVSAVVFALASAAVALNSLSGLALNAGIWLLVLGKTGVEVLAGTYGIAFLATAGAFLFMREPAEPRHQGVAERRPAVGIVYLCCDDAEWGALESFASLSYDGPLFVVIHDDSRDDRARRTVDAMASQLAIRRAWDVRVLRRPDRSGGKAGAVNYALDQSGHLYEYFLICDNDSTIVDPDTVQRGLARMQASRVGGVQFRSVPVADPAYCGANRRLAESIAAFHAFLAPAARYGWMPFIGHNAILRTAAVREAGGLTPGFFSDDLDLTVRLNLAGFRIAYAPEIEMGEKHPPSYTAFRKRTYKWAYGCVQTLRAHSWKVLTARQFSFAEKLSFFQFVGFYCLQSLLLAYVSFTLIVVPLGAFGAFVPAFIPSIVVGVILVGVVYAPLLSFYAKTPARRRSGWLTTVILCGLVYGGTDFSVFRGVVDAFRRRRRAWIPTNRVSALAVDPGLFGEAAFGLVLLLIPIITFPELLYQPAWFVFAGKFLFGPALSLVYRDDPHAALASVAGADHNWLPVNFAPDRKSTFERAGIR